MNFLTPEQRTRAVEMLSRAPDEVLITAMVEFRKIRHMEEGMKNNVNQMIDDLTERRTKDVPVLEDHRWVKDNGTKLELVKSEPEVVERPNVSPGAPSITKIGAKTKSEIMAYLEVGMHQPPVKLTEHLKLLWSRGEIKFDGERYYL